MAYLKKIPAPKCGCSRQATLTLFNRFNAPVSDHCSSCAKGALEKFQQSEDAGRKSRDHRLDEMARRRVR